MRLRSRHSWDAACASSKSVSLKPPSNSRPTNARSAWRK
uniref:Uncharacterized protein n=1 Tax=Globisporangium ultimum (strain ATCC 200006 / CBS 805.95 / DAOM BR144) TaxID=431595 RepID=K3WU42_GLOUD